MSKFFDKNSKASNPGGFHLNKEQVKFFYKELSLLNRVKQPYWIPEDMLLEQLQHGDTRAAVVMCTAPKVIVSAYTDELDCVLLLEFSEQLASKYALNTGDRLLTVNTYQVGTEPVADLWNGPDSYHRYVNFSPLIADFLTPSKSLLIKKKKSIDEAEWQKAMEIGQAVWAEKKYPPRSGNPFLIHMLKVKPKKAQ